MESSSWGKREKGRKTVAVKLCSKKVDWRLAGSKSILSIEVSIRREESESILSSCFIGTAS